MGGATRCSDRQGTRGRQGIYRAPAIKRLISEQWIDDSGAPPTPEGCLCRRSSSRRRDEGAYLRLVLDPPKKAQQIVDAIRAQVLLRHQAKLLLHFGISHWIFEVPAMVFDADD